MTRWLLALGCFTFNVVSAAVPADVYERLASDDYLGPVQSLATVTADQVFTEGPAVAADGTVYFTNVPASQILRWDPNTRALSVFRDDTGETNGLLFAPSGDLLCCEGGGRRVTRMNLPSGRLDVLADGYRGRPLAKPNDLCIDRAGRIYFTSRTATDDPAGENLKAVYRIDPGGQLVQLLAWPDVHMPNGIALSPDEKQLYLIEAHPGADHHRDIRVYDVDAVGNLANPRVLIDFYPGRSGDGMCVGPRGNLYVAAGLHALRNTSETLDTRPGIHVISPHGKLLAFRQTPIDTVTNCTLDPQQDWLYVTCGDQLLRIRVK